MSFINCAGSTVARTLVAGSQHFIKARKINWVPVYSTAKTRQQRLNDQFHDKRYELLFTQIIELKARVYSLESDVVALTDQKNELDKRISSLNTNLVSKADK